MPTEKVTSNEPKLDTNKIYNEVKENVLNDLKNKVAERFNQLKEASDNTTNVWVRHDLQSALNELKYIFENVLK